MCVGPHIKNLPWHYLGPSWESWEGPKPQGAGREQSRQQQAFHSFTDSFSHSFFPQERASGECAHVPKAQSLSSPGVFQINSGHKGRPHWKPPTFTPLSQSTVAKTLAIVWSASGHTKRDGLEVTRPMPHCCGSLTVFSRKGLKILRRCKMPKVAPIFCYLLM